MISLPNPTSSFTPLSDLTWHLISSNHFIVLCDRCLDLFEGRLYGYGLYGYQKGNGGCWTLETLPRDRNCFICHRISQTLQQKGWVSGDYPVDTEMGWNVCVDVSSTDFLTEHQIHFRLKPVSDSLRESKYFPLKCSIIENWMRISIGIT